MALNMSCIGVPTEVREVGWGERDAMLYALGVGAGYDDPAQELYWTTENTEGIALRPLPTLALVLIQRAGLKPDLGPYDRSHMVHAQQSLVLHKPLCTHGRVMVSSCVTGIEDKGSAALVSVRSDATDALDGTPWFSGTAALFIRGEGNFDSARHGRTVGRKEGAVPFDLGRLPDIELGAEIREDQALLYRLSGDRNPLHSDPQFAERGGFERPILHGLCTYGVTARVLLRHMGESASEQLRSMQARFTKPVFPGERLQVQGWRDETGFRFRTRNQQGDIVLDAGKIEFDANKRMEDEQDEQ